MAILFVHFNRSEQKELREFHENREVYFVDTRQEMIRFLSRCNCERMVLRIRRFEDLNLMYYIRRHHPEIRLTIALEPDLAEAFAFLREGGYDTISEPFHLNDLTK